MVLYLVGGERAANVLEGWKSWLSVHNGAVMAVLFLVFGVVLFSEGLRRLTARRGPNRSLWAPVRRAPAELSSSRASVSGAPSPRAGRRASVTRPVATASVQWERRHQGSGRPSR